MQDKLKYLWSAMLLMAIVAFFFGFEEEAGTLIAFNVTPLLKRPGVVSMPGLKNYVAFIPEHFVKTSPAPVDKSDGVSCILEGEFAFEGSMNFKYIDCGSRSVAHSSASQGEEGSMSFLQKGEFYHPGSRQEATEFAAEVINTPGILLTADKEGRQIVIGQPGDPVTIKCSSDLGKAATDAKGFTFTWEWDAPVPAYYLKTPVDIAALKKLPSASE